MRTKTILQHLQSPPRVAFTLIELLVVIAIIAALMALTSSAVIKYLGTQQEANTQSILDRTQSQLNKAWSKVKDQAHQESIPPAVDWGIRQDLAGNDANATERVRVIHEKLKLRQAFPMSFAEALNPAPLPPLPAYQTYLTNLGVTPNTSYGNFESSACLLMALQRGVSGAGIDPSDLTKGGTTGSFALPKGNIAFLTDTWGSPIYFARFPTGSLILNPNGPQPGNNDPGDPQGYLNDQTWAKQMPQGQLLFSQLVLQQLAPPASPPRSYKLAPLLASAGLDKTPQFDPITFQPTPGSDDLFSNP